MGVNIVVPCDYNVYNQQDSRSKFEDDDGASELTETSTFSEVTATEESDVSISRNVVSVCFYLRSLC